MTLSQAIIPEGHPNRRGDKLDRVAAYIVHSTANLGAGTGDLWHANYFARPWQKGMYWDPAVGYVANGIIEAGQIDAYHTGCGVKFRNGATHVVADCDSLTQVLPLDEYAPGAGDRALPWDELNRGEMALARIVFGFRQNWRSLQIEICEDKNWSDAAANAASWIVDDLKSRGLKVDTLGSKLPWDAVAPPKEGKVLLLRHYDVTGKNCPSRFVKYSNSWATFRDAIIAAVN
jgi:N-acetylmuramoyl-L-alanine amidase CwlA